MRRLILLFFLCAAMPAAGGGLSVLEDFLNKTPAAEIRFSEKGYDSNGDLISERQGELWFQRPGFFRVEYHPPQVLHIVSDNQSVWFYEPDLQQAIVRPFADISQLGFLSVFIGGTLDGLSDKYVLSAGLQTKPQQWIIADIRDGDDSIRQIRMSFGAQNGDLQTIEMSDVFDGEIKITVDSLHRRAMDKKIFSFVPPPGTEVIREQ